LGHGGISGFRLRDMRTDVLIFIAWKGEKIVTNVTSLGVDFLRERKIKSFNTEDTENTEEGWREGAVVSC
jgi:hypothetical protein